METMEIRDHREIQDWTEQMGLMGKTGDRVTLANKESKEMPDPAEKWEYRGNPASQVL